MSSTTSAASLNTPASTPLQSSVKDYFPVKSSIHHSPPTPTDTGADKRVRFENNLVEEPSPVTPLELTENPVPLTPPVLPPAIAAMSSDDKLNIILEKVCSTDAKFSVLASRVTALEQSAGFMDNQLEEQKAETAALKNENAVLTDRLWAAEARLGKLELALVDESRKRDENENVSRKQCLEFSGIPKLPNETRDDPKKFVIKIMNLAGCATPSSAIDDAHRKMGGGLIARFKTREDRNEVYNRRFSLTGKTSAEIEGFEQLEGNELYINESLTIDRSRLMKCVREKLKILNRGRSKEAKFKTKTTGGVIQCQGVSGLYLKVTSIEDFDRIHPNNIECYKF